MYIEADYIVLDLSQQQPGTSRSDVHSQCASTEAVDQQDGRPDAALQKPNRSDEVEPATEQQLDAMAHIRLGLRMERELNTLCGDGELGPAPDDALQFPHVCADLLNPARFDGRHYVALELLGRRLCLVDPRQHRCRVKRQFKSVQNEPFSQLHFLPGAPGWFVLLRRRLSTQQLLLSHMHVDREQPLQELVLAEGPNAVSSQARIMFNVWGDK